RSGKKKRRHRPPFYYIVWCLHVFDDFLRKFRTLQERGPFHQPVEIVGYAFRVDCAFEPFVDEVCSLLPTHVLEHHRPGKDHGTRVHLVLTGVLRSRSVSRFEDGVSRYVVNIRAGRNADTAYDGCKRIGDVVTVEVQGSHYRILIGPKENLLKKRIRDHVLHNQFVTVLLDYLPGPAVEIFRAILTFCKGITPVAETPLGKLHDVALVDECYARLLMLNREFKGRPDETLRSLFGNRLDTDTCRFWESDFLECFGKFFLEIGEEFLVFIGSFLKLDTRIDVLCVFTEEHHVRLLRLFHGRRDALEPPYRAYAGIKIQFLAQRDIQ